MSDTAVIAPPEEKRKDVVQVLEVSARILSILAGLAVGIFGHDWQTGIGIMAGGNAAASVGAKSATMLKK